MQTPAIRPQEKNIPAWWQTERSRTTYRFSWLRLYAIMAVWEAALILFIGFLEGSLLEMITSGMLMAALTIILFAAIAMALTFTIHVGETGIQGHTFWGNRSRMRWDEIESVAPSHMVGLPWLKVRSRNRKAAMWLPLFFADRRGFYESIARFAPSCPILPSSPATPEP